VAAIRKFTFDNDFDRPKAAPAKEAVAVAAPPPPTFSEAELAAAVEAARKQAHAEGVAQGRAEAAAQTERQIATALAAVAAHMGAIDRGVAATAGGLNEIAVELSLAMVRRLFPDLARRSGLGEVEALLGQCMDALRTEPRFAVRVPIDLTDAVKSRVEETAAARGYEGRITVLGDDTVKPGDCRIEWTQGGMIRSGEEIWQAVEATMQQALATIDRDGTA
jgi:flagellar assembly protein FliH